LASERLASAADPEAQRLLARVERMLAQEERMFAVGGELAAWARQHADIGPDALGRQNQPELLLQLSAIEQEMVAISAASAAVLAGSGG
jgi:hypothetical protein